MGRSNPKRPAAVRHEGYDAALKGLSHALLVCSGLYMLDRALAPGQKIKASLRSNPEPTTRSVGKGVDTYVAQALRCGVNREPVGMRIVTSKAPRRRPDPKSPLRVGMQDFNLAIGQSSRARVAVENAKVLAVPAGQSVLRADPEEPARIAGQGHRD